MISIYALQIYHFSFIFASKKMKTAKKGPSLSQKYRIFADKIIKAL